MQMTIKEEIKTSKISIIELLPAGAIGRLALTHGLSRQNVTKMLQGDFGKPDRLQNLITDALFLIEEDMAEKKEKFAYLKRRLKKNLKQAIAS